MKGRYGQIASNCYSQWKRSRKAGRPQDTNGANLLTKRELSVVHLVAEGRSNRDISHELRLSEHTARNYLFRIFNKLGVSTRLELAIYAINQREAGQPHTFVNE
jgi:DNA-binding NarL/FixJ family response regulator